MAVLVQHFDKPFNPNKTMSRSMFILLTAIYSFILAFSMIFLPETTLHNYGLAQVDVNHKHLFQYMGISNFGLGVMGFLFRNVPPSEGLRIFLLGSATLVLSAAVLGVVQVFTDPTEASTFFLVDTAFRLALGLITLYYWSKAKA